MAPVRHLRTTLLGSLLLLLPAVSLHAQQAVAPDAGCVEQKGTWHCNLSSLKLALERAHTIAVENQPRDRSTRTQLNALVEKLGKGTVAQGVPADLTIVLLPSSPTGIDLGPADHEVATLSVYAPSGMSSRGTLLWAEVLRDSGDRPWPSQVDALISQFEAKLHAR